MTETASNPQNPENPQTPKIALLFPGQGSQSVAMGRALFDAFPAARAVFDEADQALGFTLSDLIFNGPDETLRLTEHTQPAILTVSIAALRALSEALASQSPGKQIAPILAAGHSLGEYSAHVAAGTLTFADAVRAVRLRGRYMQEAVPAGEGAMAALLGCELDLAKEICAAATTDPVTGRKQVIDPANDNGGGQVVVSGAKAAVDRAVEISKEKGVRRAMLLPVSAPFHCALMAPAADAMAEALERSPPVTPQVPLIANVAAAKVTDPAEIVRLLVAQVTATVRWRECMLAMAAIGVDSFIELGSGKVLTGLVKRILPDATGAAAGTPADIELLLKSL